MKGHSQWHYRPYARLNRLETLDRPYICRLAPGRDSVEFEWLDRGCGGVHFAQVRRRGEEGWTRLPLAAPAAAIPGLLPGTDYELCVVRGDGVSSGVRLARTGAYPGTVVNYLHPDDEAYAFSGRSLCSPSLARLPSGALLASMDVYAGGAPQNLTLLFRSDDRGRRWHSVADLFPCFWGKLFWHQDALFMLANATEYGNLLVGRSLDEGRTWSAPVTILPGGGRGEQGPHKAPMPVTRCGRRLYTAVDYGSWSSGGHASGLLSIDVDADPLVAENWSCTPFLPFDEAWPGAAEGRGSALEGNAVVGPGGELLNVLRYQMSGCAPAYGRALVLRADKNDPEAPLQFGWFADFNGGSNAKFDLVCDEPSGLYWAVVNEIVDPAYPTARNVLSLAASEDLRTFRIVRRLLDHRHEDPAMVGFQYVSFVIDGEDLLFLCRTGDQWGEEYA